MVNNMADFCSLCGYSDINIEKLFSDIMKPAINEGQLKGLVDDKTLSLGFWVCEGCGIHGIQVNKQGEVFGNYCKGTELIGHLNEDNDLLIDDNTKIYKEVYVGKKKLVELEIAAMLKEQEEWEKEQLKKK